MVSILSSVHVKAILCRKGAACGKRLGDSEERLTFFLSVTERFSSGGISAKPRHLKVKRTASPVWRRANWSSWSGTFHKKISPHFYLVLFLGSPCGSPTGHELQTADVGAALNLPTPSRIILPEPQDQKHQKAILDSIKDELLAVKEAPQQLSLDSTPAFYYWSRVL